MLPECREMVRFVEETAGEPSPGRAAAMQAHVSTCPLCQQQLQRCEVLAHDLQVIQTDESGLDAHLSEMDMAHFAVHGVRAPDAGRIIDHLTRCAACRHQLVTTVTALREYDRPIIEDVAARAHRSWSKLIGLAFASPGRSALTAAAAVVFLAECASLALALALLVAAMLGGADSVRTMIGVWPLTQAVHPAIRLGVAVAALTGLGLALRQIAALLFRRATAEPRHR